MPPAVPSTGRFFSQSRQAAVRFSTTAAARSQNRKKVNERLSEIIRKKPNEYWVNLMAKAEVPCGPINTIDKVFADPQVQHLGMAAAVPTPAGAELKLVGPAIRLSRTPARMKRAIGPPGEHNDEILHELGYAESDIAALCAAKVI